MHIDFETYSEAGYRWDASANRWRSLVPSKPGIASVGAWTYSAHPSTDLISLAYDGTVWIPGMPEPTALFDHIRKGGLCWAWNSFFEYVIWLNVAVPKYGWPNLPLDQLRCAMARGRAWGLPGTLKNAGGALGLDILKDKAGGPLIRKLCCPRSPTKHNKLRRLTTISNPEDFGRFYAYNLQDIEAEEAITRVTPPLSPVEENLWLLDQKINARGVHVDRAGLENCISIFQQAENQYTQELQNITGGAVSTVGEIDRIKGWLGSLGVKTASLDKAHVAALLEQEDIPDNCRRVLEIRQILGSASVKKLFSIQRYQADDNRIRGIFAYCGAERTGRFAGRGPQPHNMPAGGPAAKQCAGCGTVQWAALAQCRQCRSAELHDTDWCIEAVELALGDLATQDLRTVEACWGDPLTAISGCLRGLFTAAPGNEFISSDYSAIEAVVLAVLSGEEWRVEVFRGHGKIYEMSAAKISGIPFEDFIAYKEKHGQHHPLRKKLGKVPELASGFAGWIGAWKAFGAGAFMSDDEIRHSIIKWRDESPMIVEFWGGQWRKTPGRWEFKPELYGLEGAALLAIQNPGQCYSYRDITYGVYGKRRRILYCRLPSGRCLAYHEPQLHMTRDARGLQILQISFMGWNSNHLNGPIGWQRIETYGGKLAENVTQATARDILTHALPNLEAAGYPLVLHVHDEPTSEVPLGYGSIEEYERIMTTLPTWAEGWPIKAAGGWRGQRYRK